MSHCERGDSEPVAILDLLHLGLRISVRAGMKVKMISLTKLSTS